MKSALFVDRDGVLNKMVRYATGWDSPQRLEDVRIVTGIENVISWANTRMIPVIEISNQPGVAKGKMTQKTADAIELRVHELLHEKNAKVDAVYICPHHPDAKIPSLKKNCDCRKPKPGLLFKVSKELNICLSGAIFLGDKATDIEAGKAAGTKTILFEHADDESVKLKELDKCNPDYKVTSMRKVISVLDNFFK